MKAVLVASAFLSVSALGHAQESKGSEPSRFCVYSGVTDRIEWVVRSAGTNTYLGSSNQQNHLKPWHCIRLLKSEEQRDLRVRVSRSPSKYSEDSCYVEVKRGGWVTVQDGKERINCENDTKTAAQVKYSKLLNGEPIFLQGAVTLSGPVVGARITVKDRQGSVFARSATSTTKDGLFAIQLKSYPTDGFVVEAEGGKDADGAIPGHLEAVADRGFDPDGSFVYVNPVTTLVSDLRDLQKMAPLPHLESQVRDYLGLPASLPLGAAISNPFQQLISTKSFADAAQSSGSIEKLNRVLAAEILNGLRGQKRFAPKRGLLKIEFNGNWAADKLGGGIAGAVTGFAFNQILSELGYKSDAQKALIELQKINARLDQIVSLLSDISKQIQESQYNQRYSDLVKSIVEARTQIDAMNILNRQWTSFIDPATGQPRKKDGQVVDLAKVLKNMELRATTKFRITTSLLSALPNINLSLVTNTNPSSSLLRLFATLALPRLITVRYFEDIYHHLEMWRTGEAMILAALVAAYGPEGEESAGQAIAQFKNAQETELPFVPNNMETLASLGDHEDPLGRKLFANEIAWDREAKMLWYTRSFKYNTRRDLVSDQKSPLAGFNPAILQAHRQLWNAMGGGPRDQYIKLWERWNFHLSGPSRFIYTDFGQMSESFSRRIPMIDWGIYQYFDSWYGPWNETSDAGPLEFWDKFHADTQDPNYHVMFWTPMGDGKWTWSGTHPVKK